MGRIATAAVALVALLAPGSACADAPVRATTLALESVPVLDGGEGTFTGSVRYETPRAAWRPSGRHTFRARLGGCSARVAVGAVVRAATPGSGARLVHQATGPARQVIDIGDGWRVVRKPDEDGERQLAAATARRAEGARWVVLQADVVAGRRCTGEQLTRGALPRALAHLVRTAKLSVAR